MLWSGYSSKDIWLWSTIWVKIEPWNYFIKQKGVERSFPRKCPVSIGNVFLAFAWAWDECNTNSTVTMPAAHIPNLAVKNARVKYEYPGQPLMEHMQLSVYNAAFYCVCSPKMLSSTHPSSEGWEHSSPNLVSCTIHDWQETGQSWMVKNISLHWAVNTWRLPRLIGL